MYMDNRILSLLQLYKEHKYNLIRDTWVALGSLEVTSNIKLYTPESIFYIKPRDPIDPQGVEGCLIYCLTTYQVGDRFQPIQWDQLSVDSVEKMVATEMGVLYPHFKILLTNDEFKSITEPIDINYIPFQDQKGKSLIQIDDNELELIMIENGVPFIDISELEYNTKAQVCNLFVKPALDEYFKWWPIIEQVNYGDVSPGQTFE